MRTLTLAGIYLAPVATFATVSSFSGYSEHLVAHSGLANTSVVAELFDFDQEQAEEVTEVSLAKSGPVSEATFEPVEKRTPGVWLLGYTSLLEQEKNATAFDELTLSAVIGQFDPLIANAKAGSFRVTATPYNPAGANAGLFAAQTRKVASYTAPKLRGSPVPRFVGRFGGSGSSGSGGVNSSIPSVLGTFGDPAVTGTISPVTASTGGAATGATGSTGSTTGGSGSTSSLEPVPLPAGAPLLVAALAALGLLRRRKA